MIIASPEDYREAAQRRLPRFLFDYLDGGAGSEQTLRLNRSDLENCRLRQQVLVDVAAIDLSTSLFGASQSLPVVLGPVGLGGMYARRGEVLAAKAAKRTGIPFCLSTVALCGLDEVVEKSGHVPWFQLYVIRDRGFLTALLDHAWQMGCRTLVFTVDMPVPGSRYRDRRSGMSGPWAPARRFLQACSKPGWAFDVGLRGRPHQLGNLAPVLGTNSGMNDYMGWLAANFDPTISWKDLDWLRDRWRGTLVIKGILDPNDARSAAALGAEGIVISNHGGRQLDGAPSTASVLPRIADAVSGALTILADSGVRNGRDIARMLALGADGVMLGRAWVYALAVGGEAGVVDMLSMIERELAVTLALTGVREVQNASPSMLMDRP